MTQALSALGGEWAGGVAGLGIAAAEVGWFKTQLNEKRSAGVAERRREAAALWLSPRRCPLGEWPGGRPLPLK